MYSQSKIKFSSISEKDERSPIALSCWFQWTTIVGFNVGPPPCVSGLTRTRQSKDLVSMSGLHSLHWPVDIQEQCGSVCLTVMWSLQSVVEPRIDPTSIWLPVVSTFGGEEWQVISLLRCSVWGLSHRNVFVLLQLWDAVRTRNSLSAQRMFKVQLPTHYWRSEDEDRRNHAERSWPLAVRCEELELLHHHEDSAFDVNKTVFILWNQIWANLEPIHHTLAVLASLLLHTHTHILVPSSLLSLSLTRFLVAFLGTPLWKKKR